jgi:hypothetical protein
VLVTVLGISGAGTALPASLAVAGNAAFAGEYGLRVEPGCGHPFSLEILSSPVATLPDEVVACTTITARGIDITPPGSTFRAGKGILLGDLFRVVEDASFTAVIDDSLLPFAWVEDELPASETTYKARFFLDLDELTLAPGDRLEHFVGYSAQGIAQFRVVLKRADLLPENRLVLEARQDDGGYLSTSAANEELLLEAGWNEIRLAWKAADPGEDNGWLRAEVANIGTAQANVVELSCVTEPGDPCLVNRRSRVDFVRWGAVDGLLLATFGSMDLDDFVSWK